MRNDPPKDFDINRFFEGIYTFQKWEIFPGHCTTGSKDVVEHMHRLRIPDRLDGLRILDIAPWNGFFGFECVRRGAAEVVSFGPDDPNETGYNKTRQLLRLDNCKYIQGSVYDLSPEIHGHFDIVLFLGLIYHLRYPLLALDRIYDVTKDRLFADSPISDWRILDKTVSVDHARLILQQGRIMNQLPLTYFTKGSETGDPYNWFIPNKCAFRDFVKSSGFIIDHFFDDAHWASIAATKAERNFVVNIEGYNKKAAKTHPEKGHAGVEEKPQEFTILQCPVCSCESVEFSTLKFRNEYFSCLNCEFIFSDGMELYKSTGSDSHGITASDPARLEHIKTLLGKTPEKILDYSATAALDFPAVSLDAITMIDVIGHIGRPLELIQQLASLLKHGGIIYIEGAFVDFLWNPAASDYIDPRFGHFYIHSRKSIAYMSEKTGLIPEWINNNVVILRKGPTAHPSLIERYRKLLRSRK
jgi:tRNA (mo5U34)-methyltransferase